MVKSAYEPSGSSGRHLSGVSGAQSNLKYFYFPLDGMLVQCRVTLSVKFADTYVYTLGGERYYESKVTCPRIQCNVMSLARGPFLEGP